MDKPRPLLSHNEWSLNQVNRPIESNFRAFQNLIGEHSVKGDPASLYNLAKSAPDPFIF